MDEERPRKRGTMKFIRAARAKRIVERLREGFVYDEIAGQEKLTERRVRQIVAEALEGREALESAVHAHRQVARLGQAVRAAGEARPKAQFASKALTGLDFRGNRREILGRIVKLLEGAAEFFRSVLKLSDGNGRGGSGGNVRFCRSHSTLLGWPTLVHRAGAPPGGRGPARIPGATP